VGVIAANQDVRDAVGHALDDLHVSWTTLKEDSSPTADVVKISTIESAKGHEFTHVFIPGLAEGILPREVPEDDMSREAARLYVAMTRARDYLCLSYTSDSRYRPSRFLAALQADCTEFVWNGYFLQPIE
jgi:superfamily I DNA/RNA helicase